MGTVPMQEFEGKGFKPLVILSKTSHIGEWIEEIFPKKEYDAAAQATKWAEEAKELGLAFGWARDGRDDTGSNVIANHKQVVMMPAFVEIKALGYRCTRASWFIREDDRGAVRFLELEFKTDGVQIDVPPEIKEIFERPTAWCNIWANLRPEGFRLDTWNIRFPNRKQVEEELHFMAQTKGPAEKHLYTYTCKLPLRR